MAQRDLFVGDRVVRVMFSNRSYKWDEAPEGMTGTVLEVNYWQHKVRWDRATEGVRVEDGYYGDELGLVVPLRKG